MKVYLMLFQATIMGIVVSDVIYDVVVVVNVIFASLIVVADHNVLSCCQ